MYFLKDKIQLFVESHCAIEESSFSEYCKKKGLPSVGALMGTCKTPMTCIWHVTQTRGQTSSVHLHIYVLLQIWLKYHRL